MDKEKVVYISIGVLFSHKENEIMSFTGKWMELEITILIDISQTQRDEYYVHLF
jgi:hypothetical protein